MNIKDSYIHDGAAIVRSLSFDTTNKKLQYAPANTTYATQIGVLTFTPGKGLVIEASKSGNNPADLTFGLSIPDNTVSGNFLQVEKNTDGTYTVKWAPDHTYDTFTAATSAANGNAGLVTAPGTTTVVADTDARYFLCANTNWIQLAARDIPGLSTSKLTSGTLGTGRGGTNKDSWTAYSIPFLSNATTFGEVTIGNAGQALVVNSTKTGYTWATFNNYSLPTAATNALGGIKIGKDNTNYAVTAAISNISADVTTGKYYAVEIDKNDKAFVYVPWDTNPTSLKNPYSLTVTYSDKATDPTTVTYDGSEAKSVTLNPTNVGLGNVTNNKQIPLAGSSTSAPITGTLYIDNVNGLYINSHNTDLNIWHIVGNSGAWDSQFGFNLQYKGTSSGNNNDLILWAHNQSGTPVEVYRVHQDGAFIFKSTPSVNVNGTNTAVSLSTHNHNSSYVSAVALGTGDNVDKLAVTKNGSTTHLIIPFATSSTYAANIGSSSANLSYATLKTMYDWYAEVTGTDSDSTETTINRWQEIVGFLDGITDTSTLSGILAGYSANTHTHGNITNDGKMRSYNDTNDSGKFLRADGTWATPSYTIDTNTVTSVVIADNNTATSWANTVYTNPRLNFVKQEKGATASVERSIQLKAGTGITIDTSSNNTIITFATSGVLQLQAANNATQIVKSPVEFNHDVAFHNNFSADTVEIGNMIVKGTASFLSPINGNIDWSNILNVPTVSGTTNGIVKSTASGNLTAAATKLSSGYYVLAASAAAATPTWIQLPASAFSTNSHAAAYKTVAVWNTSTSANADTSVIAAAAEATVNFKGGSGITLAGDNTNKAVTIGLTSTYAGGTAVTLNGTDKSGSTASFYAPTSAAATDAGKVLKVATNGGVTWDAANNHSHSGLYAPVQIFTSTGFSVGSAWTTVTNSGTELAKLAAGTYIVQVIIGSSYASGVFSLTANDAVKDEIPLHMSGANDSPRVFLKMEASGGKTIMQIATDSATAANRAITITVKRII